MIIFMGEALDRRRAAAVAARMPPLKTVAGDAVHVFLPCRRARFRSPSEPGSAGVCVSPSQPSNETLVRTSVDVQSVAHRTKGTTSRTDLAQRSRPAGSAGPQSTLERNKEEQSVGAKNPQFVEWPKATAPQTPLPSMFPQIDTVSTYLRQAGYGNDWRAPLSSRRQTMPAQAFPMPRF